MLTISKDSMKFSEYHWFFMIFKCKEKNKVLRRIKRDIKSVSPYLSVCYVEGILQKHF